MSLPKIKAPSDLWERTESKLLVYVMEGISLVTKHGAGSPYVKLVYDRQKQKTQICKHSEDVSWKELFLFDVLDEQSDLILEVWTKSGLSEKMIGSCVVCKPCDLDPEALVDRVVDLEVPSTTKAKHKEHLDSIIGNIRLRLLFSREREVPMKPPPNMCSVFTYRDYYQQMRTGDLIVFSGVGSTDSLCKVLSGTKYSRVGLVVRLPDKWTAREKLYLFEVTRNLARELDGFREACQPGATLFRLFDHLHAVSATDIWWVPLKSPLEKATCDNMVDWIKEVVMRKTTIDYPVVPPEVREFFERYELSLMKHPWAHAEICSASAITTALRLGGKRFPFEHRYLSCVQLISQDCFADPIIIRERSSTPMPPFHSAVTKPTLSLATSGSMTSIQHQRVGSSELPSSVGRRSLPLKESPPATFAPSATGDEASNANTIIGDKPRTTSFRSLTPPSTITPPSSSNSTNSTSASPAGSSGAPVFGVMPPAPSSQVLNAEYADETNHQEEEQQEEHQEEENAHAEQAPQEGPPPAVAPKPVKNRDGKFRRANGASKMARPNTVKPGVIQPLEVENAQDQTRPRTASAGQKPRLLPAPSGMSMTVEVTPQQQPEPPPPKEKKRRKKDAAAATAAAGAAATTDANQQQGGGPPPVPQKKKSLRKMAQPVKRSASPIDSMREDLDEGTKQEIRRRRAASIRIIPESEAPSSPAGSRQSSAADISPGLVAALSPPPPVDDTPPSPEPAQPEPPAPEPTETTPEEPPASSEFTPKQALVLWTFEAMSENELNVTEGETVTVVGVSEEWALVDSKGQRGAVPTSFLSME